MSTVVDVSCDCGYSGRVTPGRVEYTLRRHSCEKYRRMAAAAARFEARMAAIDRTPKPCNHKRAQHQHGTYACYTLDACRCAPCSAATSAYNRRTAREQGYGRWENLVDAEPVRQHIRSLQQMGLGLKRIEDLAGLSAGQMGKLVYGALRADGTRRPPAARVSKTTARRVLAVRFSPDLIAAGALVDSTGSRRRVQALVAVGWSQSKIAERLGMSGANLWQTLRRPTVTARRARAITALYDELWNAAPPAGTPWDKVAIARAKRTAAQHGYLPPLAWDDDTIDDPDTQPTTGAETTDVLDEIAIERLMNGTLRADHCVGGRGVKTPPEVIEAIRRLAAAGHPDTEISRRIGMGRDAVLKHRHRNGIDAGQLLTYELRESA